MSAEISQKLEQCYQSLYVGLGLVSEADPDLFTDRDVRELVEVAGKVMARRILDGESGWLELLGKEIERNIHSVIVTKRKEYE